MPQNLTRKSLDQSLNYANQESKLLNWNWVPCLLRPVLEPLCKVARRKHHTQLFSCPEQVVEALTEKPHLLNGNTVLGYVRLLGREGPILTLFSK